MTADAERAPSSATTDAEKLHRELAAALRSRVLSLAPYDIGIESADKSSCYGVVIETAHPDVVASFVALADGSVSLYVSNGTGCVGCGEHDEVHRAGLELIKIAQGIVRFAPRTKAIDRPSIGTVRFHFLCGDGARAVQLRVEELNAHDSLFATLYFSAQQLLNMIERVGAGQSLAREIHRAAVLRDATAKESPSCLSVGSAVRRLPI